MSLIPSLLQAIVKVDGEAMVMHAGDKPYVVSPTGQIELASRGLTLEAVNGIVGQLLPTEIQNALDEFGAIQYELLAVAELPEEHFTVVAARGGDDVWVEIRRRRVVDDDRVPDELFAPASAAPAPEPPSGVPAAGAPPLLAGADRVVEPLDDQAIGAIDETFVGPISPMDEAAVGAIDEPRVEQTVESAESDAPALDRAISVDDDLLLPEVARLRSGRGKPASEPAVETPADAFDLCSVGDLDDDVQAPPPGEAGQHSAPQNPVEPAPPPVATIEPPPVATIEPPPIVRIAPPVLQDAPPAAASPPKVAPPPVEPVARAAEPPQPAVVLPIARSPIRADAPPPLVSDVALSGLERLLRLSSARGASTLYLSSESRPSVRVDGELRVLDGEPVHTSRDVESLLLTLMPERSHEALRTGALTEWITDIEGVGRVRCMSFRDHRGPGGVFRLMPTRSVSVEQLGLPRQVQSLAIEPEGLVLVAGPRSSGKRTLMAAFVDLMNRTRRDHIITIEREINILHARGSSFISQREVRGNDDELLAAARGALREDPDVLMIEDLRTGGLMNVALEAAASGHLVVGGFSAHTATGAIDRIIDLYAPEYRRQVQFALADSLRGVIVQVLLKKIGGGRLPAREVLLNTPAVSSVIAEGKTSQLPMAIEGGRRYGMMPLNDALVGLVRSGSVEARDAYRQSTDRPGFLAALNREGIDTSFVERLA
jgi:twitching motility protein PilT